MAGVKRGPFLNGGSTNTGLFKFTFDRNKKKLSSKQNVLTPHFSINFSNIFIRLDSTYSKIM